MDDNYYDNLLTTIDSLIKNNEYQKANAILEEELQMPYIPMNINDKLLEYKDYLSTYLIKEKQPTILQKEQIVQYLKKDNDCAYKALETLSSLNIRNYLDVVQEALLDKNINHVMKNIIIELLVNQQVDESIEVDDGRKFTIVPSKLKNVLSQNYINLVSEKLCKIVYNNPSFLQQCQLIAVNVAYDKYPFEVDINKIDIIVNSIIRYVYLAYDQLEQWNEFKKVNDIDENQLEEYSF